MLFRILFALGALALAAASVRYYRYDAERREPVEKLIRDFTIEQRRPIAAEDSRNRQTWDQSAFVIADAALRDSLGSINLGDLSEEERRVWIEAVTKFDLEVAAARRLMVDAVAARPGWPFHAAVLGQLVYAEQRRQPGKVEQWLVPLTVAAARAPANEGLQIFLAGALLENYDRIPAKARQTTPAHLRRAFTDPSFVRRAFVPAMQIVGREQTLAALPQQADAVNAALNAVGKAGDLATAAQLVPLWERIELADRNADIATIEREARLDNISKQHDAALAFVNQHRVEDFDTAPTRAQWLTVLRHYPNSRAGVWPSDPRAAIIQHFLRGRIDFKRTEAFAPLEEAVEGLAGAPDVVRARALLAAGNAYDAETIFKKSPTAGAFEWTPFLVDLAKYQLARGERARALEALGQISPAAREECDVRTTRASILGERSVDSIDSVFPPEAWSSRQQLSLCIDAVTAQKNLHVTLAAPQPTLVDFGWDGARKGTLLISGLRQFTLPLQSLSGRRTFYVQSRTAVPVTPTAHVRE